MTIDRITARALVEAGYIPLPVYIEMFEEEVSAEAFHRSPNTAPDISEVRDLLARRQTSKDASVV